MRKLREEYAYIAHRINPNDSQNLGDFAIMKWNKGRPARFHYHYASEEYPGMPWRKGRLTNRITLMSISGGTRIFNECMRAIDRLLAEEAGKSDA